MRDKGRRRGETASEQNGILLRGNFNARAEQASLKLNRNIWTGFEVNMCNFKGLRWFVMLCFFFFFFFKVKTFSFEVDSGDFYIAIPQS